MQRARARLAFGREPLCLRLQVAIALRSFAARLGGFPPATGVSAGMTVWMSPPVGVTGSRVSLPPQFQPLLASPGSAAATVTVAPLTLNVGTPGSRVSPPGASSVIREG